MGLVALSVAALGNFGHIVSLALGAFIVWAAYVFGVVLLRFLQGWQRSIN